MARLSHATPGRLFQADTASFDLKEHNIKINFMKTSLRLKLKTVFGTVFIMFVNSSCGFIEKPCPCTPELTKTISKVYLYGSPIVGDGQRLSQLVLENAVLFQQNGEGIRCLEHLSGLFINSAIETYSPGDYDNAYAKVIEMGGSGETARGVADDMAKGSLDMLQMGEELRWFSQVLPTAANGDWTAYNNTGTDVRNAIRFAWPMIMQSIDISDPLYANLLNEELRKLSAQIYADDSEYSIMLLSILTCQ
jgi:hypothetical protein